MMPLQQRRLFVAPPCSAAGGGSTAHRAPAADAESSRGKALLLLFSKRVRGWLCPWAGAFLLLLVSLSASAATKKKPVAVKKPGVAARKPAGSRHAGIPRTAAGKGGPRHTAVVTQPAFRHKPALIKQTVIVHGRRVTRYVPARQAPAPVQSGHLTTPYSATVVPQQRPIPTPAYAPDPITTPPAAPTVLADEPAQSFLYPAQLAPFFKSLADLNPAATQDPLTTYQGQAATVRVLQFGDSHTAADIFSGAVRAQLQTRFGNGGLGFQYPGHPFAGYHLAGSTRSQSEGWFTEGNKFTQLGSGDLGLGGISLSTHRAGEYILLSTTCTSLQVEFLRQTAGGRLRFVDNGTTVADIDTALTDPNETAGTYTYACTPGLHDLQLSTLDDAPVKLLGWVTEQPGITYECLGINGAVATLMLRWNQALFGDFLRQRAPNLIVLAYGTNEAVYIASHSEEYLEDFERLLGNLHRIVPQAAILVLGPYDRATRIGRGRRSSWATFYGTERVIADQKLACKQMGCAFYDQQERMGGPGAMIRWAADGLAQPDRTHLTGAGYRTMADALYRDLMAAYKAYQQQPATAHRTPVPALRKAHP